MDQGASDPVAAAIGGWRPRELGAAAREFAREAVRSAATSPAAPAGWW